MRHCATCVNRKISGRRRLKGGWRAYVGRERRRDSPNCGVGRETGAGRVNFDHVREKRSPCASGAVSDGPVTDPCRRRPGHRDPCDQIAALFGMFPAFRIEG